VDIFKDASQARWIFVIGFKFVKHPYDDRVHRQLDQPGGLQLLVAELEEGVARTLEQTRGWEGILDFSVDVDPKTFVLEDLFKLGLPDGELGVAESLEGFDVLDGVDETHRGGW
jgi:hypothetical protein